MKTDRLYLVTGAAGFLGSTVCRQLLENGYKVRGFALPGDKYAKHVPAGVELISGDVTKSETLDAFFNVPSGVETVLIHCASMVRTNPDYHPMLVAVNVDGTENIIAKCLEHKECKKMVYVGSTGSIPELPKGKNIKEVENYDADKVVGWYSRTKAMAAQKVMDAVRQKGLKACIVHPSGILGPEDFSNSTTTHLLLEILKGEMPIGMGGSFNLCDVRDLAAACISAVENGRIGESYILGNEEVTLKQLSRLLVKESGCKPIRFFLPLWIAMAIARQQEKKAKKTGKQPLMTTFSVYNLKRNNSFDSSKAHKELGYTPRSYAQTIHDQIQWFISSGQY